jgi:uncharacterized protein YdiU (UPF0061 family)
MIPTPFHPSALPWLNRYAALGRPFAHHQPGQALPDPRWVATSDAAAADLGWPADWWTQPGALAAFSAGTAWPGMQTAATVYSGHQFGVWAGQLGDGRALLLGEVDGPNGPRELQLKGSGMTPYSRRADGRAVLRSSIREFLCSDAGAGAGGVGSAGTPRDGGNGLGRDAHGTEFPALRALRAFLSPRSRR